MMAFFAGRDRAVPLERHIALNALRIPGGKANEDD